MINMLMKKENGEQGAASMIVVIFMSIILTIVTIGFIRIAINEQRDSTDEDLAARAFYAAESGLEDARRAIQENQNNTLSDADLNATTCSKPDPSRYDQELSAPTEFDIEYTCMLIDFLPAVIRTELASPNQVRQYEINAVNPGPGSAAPTEITLRWHIDADPVSSNGDGVIGGGGLALRSTSDFGLPSFGSWNSPAAMKVSILAYPDGNIGRGTILNYTTLIVPTDDDGAGVNGKSGRVFIGGGVGPASDGLTHGADCNPNLNGMVCEMVFDLQNTPVNHKLEIRLSNLYARTTFELTMENAVGDPLVFDGAQVVADVTGRSGEVFRRVEAAMDLTKPDLLPEYAVQSATDICKNFSFTNRSSEFIGRSGTSCTQ